jgi:hypothetical protein
MGIYQDNEYYAMQELVKTCQLSSQTDKRLEMCYNLCQMLSTQAADPKMEKEVKQMGKFTQELLTSHKFRRLIHKRHALMEREPITYFGDEILKDDMYDYDEEFEKQVTNIEFKITTFLGNVLAFIQENQGI